MREAVASLGAKSLDGTSGNRREALQGGEGGIAGRMSRREDMQGGGAWHCRAEREALQGG